MLCDQLIASIDLVCSFKEMKVGRRRLISFPCLHFVFIRILVSIKSTSLTTCLVSTRKRYLFTGDIGALNNSKLLPNVVMFHHQAHYRRCEEGVQLAECLSEQRNQRPAILDHFCSTKGMQSFHCHDKFASFFNNSLQSYECERYLEQEGLFSYFTILDFPLGFIPFDRDLFSLELNDSYQDYLLVRVHCLLFLPTS